MIQITWHYGEPPKNMPVRQVYAIAFDIKGRVLLKVENKNGKTVYSMFGGTPEDFDKDRIATLKREFVEEANTTLKEPIYLVGYQEIEGDGDRPTYAQLRMVALIDKIGQKQPDPDNGETYDRILVAPEKAIELLGWGEVGKKQIEQATKMLDEKFGIKTTCKEIISL